MKNRITAVETGLTVGLDLGDRRSQVCVTDAVGEVRQRVELSTSRTALEKYFGSLPPSVVVLEVGTHSPWVSRMLSSLGHRVLVANPRRVRLIYQNQSKCDRVDAESLARLARVDPRLLSPIQHRSPQRQMHLAHLRARDALVKTRTSLVNHVRGSVKAVGGRLPKCSASSFSKKAGAHLPEELAAVLKGVLTLIGVLSEEIRQVERNVSEIARKHYPEVATVTQPKGVGLLSGLRFILTLENPRRFRRNRSAGAFIGLTPGRDQSGSIDRQKHITKAGDPALRWTLLQCSQYILGRFGPDSDLKRYGLKLCARGGKSGKKRALVAVARRLAVLMMSLWKTGEVYEPLRHAEPVRVTA